MADSNQSKFSIKNTVRNEKGELIGFTAWENGKKFYFARTSFDPGYNTKTRWAECKVVYMDKTQSPGKINIGHFDRLSDYMNFGPKWIPFCSTIDGNGRQDQFKIINKDNIKDIIPLSNPDTNKDADIDRNVELIGK